MKPVMQEFLHDPENGVLGDCFRACVASILELPLTEVPHFCPNNKDGGWYKDLIAWLDQFDLIFFEVHADNEHAKVWKENFALFDCYHTICGPSPRFPDELHVLVGYNGVAIHDPHPDNAGVTETSMYGFFVKKGKVGVDAYTTRK